MIGMGRSGTTVISEVLSSHEDLAWIPNYMHYFPSFEESCLILRLLNLPKIGFYLRGKKKQDKHLLSFIQRILPHMIEGYPVWEKYLGDKIKYDFLIDAVANATEKQMARELVLQLAKLQGKNRFLAKFTGPPRISYLNSIFPDAVFIHIVRHPIAVIRSLLNVSFWKENEGLTQLWWKNGPNTDIGIENFPEKLRPLVLAATQWKDVIQVAWQEKDAIGSNRYIEMRYEDFVENPHSFINQLVKEVDLSDSTMVHRFIDRTIKPSNMNYKFQGYFDEAEIKTIRLITNPVEARLGYSAY